MIKKLCILFIVIASIAKQSQAQIITTVAGNGTQGYSGDGGQATAASFYDPYEVAFDAAGNMYIADQSNNRIRKVNTTGIINTFAGNGGTGFGGDGGQATAAELNNPTDVTFDVTGNMYITDATNNCIRKVNISGIITTVVGGVVSGYSGDGGQATAAKLSGPAGVAFDAAGNLYIADYGNCCIRKVNTAGIISTIVGNGNPGYSGDGGAATAAQLNLPAGVAFDAAGNLYIADQTNQRIRKINTIGIITTIAGNGTQGFSGDGGAATLAKLGNPQGVVVDAVGNIYIVDNINSRIRKVNSLGIISTIVGNGTPAYSGDGGNATAAELYYPRGITVDAVGNLYIADNSNNRIRKIAMCYIPTVSYTLTADYTPHTYNAVPAYSPYIASARWYWGDGKDTLALYPSHTYSVAGRYNICVTAYSACGDSAQSCQNDTVYRLGNNSAYSTMVYINVDSSSTHTTGTPLSFGEGQGVRLYPNPASTSLTLTLSQAEGTYSFSIYDMLGNTVKQSIIYNTESIINIADLSNGMYQLRVLKNNNTVYQTKVVKQD